MMLHRGRLVVGRQGQDEPHHRLEVPLEDLSAADLVHAHLLAGHELQHPVKVLPHPLQRLGLLNYSSNLLSS